MRKGGHLIDFYGILPGHDEAFRAEFISHGRLGATPEQIASSCETDADSGRVRPV